MAGFKVRKEEYTTLADFILPSFTRDIAVFKERFPKFNPAYLASFNAKNALVKKLESSIIVTEKQKKATASLYVEAAILNNELNFLKENFKDASLNTTLITDLKKDLFSHNIEGAILKTESLEQLVTENQAILEDEGMAGTFAQQLAAHKTSLETKNKDQSEYMKQLKTLTDNNTAHYKELYEYITKVAIKGRLLFKESRIKDEYSITKNLSKMRVAKQAENVTSNP